MWYLSAAENIAERKENAVHCINNTRTGKTGQPEKHNFYVNVQVQRSQGRGPM